MLLTARSAPSRLGTLAARSRVAAERRCRPCEIGAPDEALLKTVLLKHFADRQLDVDPKVLEFLALHIDRSLAAAAAAVEAVDRAALAIGPQDQPPARGRGLGATEVPPD